MTKQTQIIQPLLNWVIDCPRHVVPATEPKSRGCFTKLTKGKSDMAMADEPNVGQASLLDFKYYKTKPNWIAQP